MYMCVNMNLYWCQMTYPQFIYAYEYYCLSVRLPIYHIFRFLCICWQSTWKEWLKIGLLMYPDDLPWADIDADGYCRFMGFCSDLQVDFVDNNPAFHLQDGSFNEGYLLPDNVHLTRAATNKLVSNLKLELRQGHTTAHSDHRRRGHAPDGTSDESWFLLRGWHECPRRGSSVLAKCHQEVAPLKT